MVSLLFGFNNLFYKINFDGLLKNQEFNVLNVTIEPTSRPKTFKSCTASSENRAAYPGLVQRLVMFGAYCT